MITREALDSVQTHLREDCLSILRSEALRMLISTQIEINIRSVLEGPETENPEELANRIIEVRRQNNLLEDLLTLGADY